MARPLVQLSVHQAHLASQNAAIVQTCVPFVGTIFDGIARHTEEGYAFQQRAAEAGFKQAVRERDEPFGDHGASTFKG
jgi:enoyl-CoA hydratase